MRCPKPTVVVLALLASATPATAQVRISEGTIAHAMRMDSMPVRDSRANWSDVQAIAIRSLIRVVYLGRTAEGKLARADPDAIALESGLVINQKDVEEVQVMRGTRRRTHVAAGFAIGALAGTIVAAVKCHGHGWCMEGSPGFTLPAAGLGMVIGASVPAGHWETVFEKRSAD